jgi:hypothetical protein
MAEKFISNAIKKPGALHKELGVSQGKKIPKGKIEKAAKAKGKLGERARFAETLEGMNKKKKPSMTSVDSLRAYAKKKHGI